MLTPAQIHRQKSLAAQSLPTEQPSTNAPLLMQLVDHKREIGSTQSIETRTQKKREFLPLYAGFLDGVLDAGKGLSEDDTTLLQELYIWVIDTFDLTRILPLYEYMTEHNIGTPERINRNLSAFTVEELGTVGLSRMKSGIAVTKEELSLCNGLTILTQDKDMNDKARATWLKFVGLSMAVLEQYPAAADTLRRADALCDAIGVKGEIKRLDKIITDLAKSQNTEQQQ